MNKRYRQAEWKLTQWNSVCSGLKVLTYTLMLLPGRGEGLGLLLIVADPWTASVLIHRIWQTWGNVRYWVLASSSDSCFLSPGQSCWDPCWGCHAVRNPKLTLGRCEWDGGGGSPAIIPFSSPSCPPSWGWLWAEMNFPCYNPIQIPDPQNHEL